MNVCRNLFTKVPKWECDKFSQMQFRGSLKFPHTGVNLYQDILDTED